MGNFLLGVGHHKNFVHVSETLPPELCAKFYEFLKNKILQFQSGPRMFHARASQSDVFLKIIFPGVSASSATSDFLANYFCFLMI